MTSGRPKQSHCQRGHEFSPANTYTSPKGARCCKACRHARQQEDRLRNKRQYRETRYERQADRARKGEWYTAPQMIKNHAAGTPAMEADGRVVWLALHSDVRHDPECFDGWPLDQMTGMDFAPLRHDGVCGPLAAVPRGGGVTPWDALEAVLNGPWRGLTARGRYPAGTSKVTRAVNSW